MALVSVYDLSHQSLARLKREQASAAAVEISRFVGGIEQQVRTVALAPGITTLEQRRDEYQRLLRLIPSLTELRFVDNAAREQLTVSRIALTTIGANTDRSSHPAVNGARAAGSYYGPVYFRDGSQPYLTLAIAGLGTPPSVTISEVNLTFTGDVVRSMATAERGEAYVVDRLGQLVAHPDFGLVLRQTDMRSLPQVALALRTGEARPHEFIVGRSVDGREVLATYQVINPPGWLVFIEQPASEAFVVLYASLVRTALLTAFGILIALLASLFFARHMVRPIEALRAGAERIGAGALAHRIEVGTGDELQELAEDFNRMAANLEEERSGLERKIGDRTRDLAIALSTIERQAAQLTNFVTPQIAELLSSPEGQRLLEGHRREISIVVCDMRGFTAFSETAEPEEALGVLREYQTMLGAEITRFGGTLEHFEGDGAMVYFNDPVPIPAPAEQAVRMAVAMRDVFVQFAKRWAKHGYKLGFGIGIAKGYATLGRIGFEGRFDYGAIGIVVNLAHRLCGSAADGHILITERVLSDLGKLAEVESVGGLEAKGFTHPIPAFNVLRLNDVSMPGEAAS